LIEIFF